MARKKIVYLLGAGASYNSLPVIETMIDSMDTFLRYLLDYFPEKSTEISEYIRLCREMKFFRTPDTLAKQRFLTNKGDNKVHKLLSTYLIFEQLEKSPETLSHYQNLLVRHAQDDEVESGWEKYRRFQSQLDSRYLSFFATILKANDSHANPASRLPHNVSLISWNYDSQVEHAFQRFFKQPFCTAQKSLSCFPSLTHYNMNQEDLGDINLVLKEQCPGFSLIKLNGCAGYKVHDRETLFDPSKHSTNPETLEMLLRRLIERDDSENVLAFAWEDQPEIKAARAIAKKKIESASVLVIIGYSFPDFNREIDRFLFENFHFDSIYLQDPKAPNIVQRLSGVHRRLKDNNDEIELITDTDTFYIPREFWEEI